MTVEDAILSALSEIGLGAEHGDEVRRMLEDPELADRPCCGGFCDPCVGALRRARDRARALLGAARA